MTDSLFDHAANNNPLLVPLAERMRPQRLGDVMGQSHLIGPGQILSEAIKGGRLPSMILWGPPGSGKTTIARLLSRECGADFYALSAVLAGVKELRATLEEAEKRRSMTQRPALLFIDEIHRFNKNQQDALLDHVERGVVTLVGATTENPSFEVNGALLSRCRVLVLRPLDVDAIRRVLEEAFAEPHRGLGHGSPNTDERAALTAMAELCDGDARRALSMLETADALSRAQNQSLTLDIVKIATQNRSLGHDKHGDQHYQLASALIKSLRGSDPDAALYWLARLLAGGEDPLFICRRLVIFASEDIGNADPGALAVAMHVTEAVRFVGLPEGELSLAQAVTYLALAPKSNRSMEALQAAKAAVEAHGRVAIPLYLTNAPTKLMEQLGHGEGYDYPHAHADGIGRQKYLPPELDGQRFYQPSDRGREAELQRRLNALIDFRKGQ